MRAFIYSNLFIALCAAILTLGSYKLMGLSPDPYLVLHIFAVTLMAYNVQRLVRLSRLEALTDQTRWYRANRWALVTALLLGLVLSLLTLMHIDWRLLLQFAPLAALSFFYSVPLIPRSEGAMALRELPGMKIFLIAAVWTGVTLILPACEAERCAQPGFLWLCLERFAFILAITIPFDIRDLHYDADELKTIPQLIGRRAALRLAQALLLGAALLSLYFQLVLHESTWLSAAPALLYLLTASILPRLCRSDSDLLYTGLLDGTMLILGLILLAL